MKVTYRGGPLGANILRAELEAAGLTVRADYGSEIAVKDRLPEADIQAEDD